MILMQKYENMSTRLRTVLEIWKNVESTDYDALHQHPIVPKMVARVNAELKPVTGSLLNGRNDSLVSKTTHKAVMRYRRGITDDCWIVDRNGEKYDIDYILNPYDVNQVLELFLQVRHDGKKT